MKPLVCSLLILSAAAVWSAEQQSDAEFWNEGVEYYRGGDVTNALKVFGALMSPLHPDHYARAAEMVAKLEYDRGDFEAAARAAQIALSPRMFQHNVEDSEDRGRAERNFTRATDRLPELRETKRVNAILEAAKGKDPAAMLEAATYDARDLMKAAGGISTNRADRQVALADMLSKRAEKLADVWLPVREVIAQSVTNEQQAATILAQIEEAQTRTKQGARELGDLDHGAYSSLALAEQDFTRFFKLTAMPPSANREGLVAQSNAWQDVEVFNGRPWQQEALDYTRAFRQKFPAWAKAYEEQAQADTNREPFTAEAQSKISALATEVEKIQLECLEKQLPPRQEEALRLLTEIAQLLPKDKNGGGQNQQQNQQQNQPNQQPQQNQQQPDQQQPQSSPDDSSSQSDQKEDQQQSASDDEQEGDKEVDAVLKKAQERNDEHEAEKKARMRKAPLPPNERDW